MFNRTNLLIVAVAITGALLGLFAGSFLDFGPNRTPPPGVTMLKTGDSRADLQLADSTGTARRLSEWNGKVVLLNFWATWCGPCRDEMPLLDRKSSELADKGLQVVGIAIDDTASVTHFLAENPVRYPILIGGEADPDPSLLFGDSRGVLPYSVLIDRDGKIIGQRSGGLNEAGLNRWLKGHL